jgi:hypothetical protein
MGSRARGAPHARAGAARSADRRSPPGRAGARGQAPPDPGPGGWYRQCSPHPSR